MFEQELLGGEKVNQRLENGQTFWGEDYKKSSWKKLLEVEKTG